eukprot:TRINITY_DN5385_c0_g1_i1.p1 TRINITY_DN5385_c0_g1~~TRINITY_DN5385_c0_g1_i1.p1  ORF type:complete len:603 (-),score=89.53 TRINITY_DN5385_c0_g1_i1:149-1957(-)
MNIFFLKAKSTASVIAIALLVTSISSRCAATYDLPNVREYDDVDGVILLQSGITAMRSSVHRTRIKGSGEVSKQALLGVDAASSRSNSRSSYIDLPVEGSVWSVMAVTVIYFILYALLAVAHSFNQAQDKGPGPLERALESAVMGVCFAPMLCVLFFVVYKRADNLAATSAVPNAYDQPPLFVRRAMPFCVVTFGIQTVLYIIKEWHLNREVDLTDKVRPVSVFWNTIFNLAMIGMYVATGSIIFGVVDMNHPQSIKDVKSSLQLSSGTFCSLCLVVLYFAVYAALHIAKTLDIWNLGRGSSPEILRDPFRYVIEVLKLAATTMSFAPMLAVLFIAAQLTVDAAHETLPEAVETSMYLCCFVLFVQVTLAIVTPFITGAELKVAPGRLDVVDFVTAMPRLFLLLSIIRWVCMAALYMGIAFICVYLWRQTDEPAWAILVTHLSTYFFLVYLALWGAITMRQLSGGGMTSGIRTLTSAKDTVALCPMLSVLFIESWVKAARITRPDGQHGVPPGFTQDYMFVVSYAILLQLLLTCINGLVWTLPQDSKVMKGYFAGAIRAGLSALSFLFYLTMVLTFTSILMVLLSLFTMTPENANGTGAWFS